MKRLSDLSPAEVSLVGKGANKKKFLIFKSEKGNPMTQQQIQAMLNSIPKATMEKIEKKVACMKTGDGDMLPKKDSAVYKDQQVEGEGVADDRQPLDDHSQAALKAVARILAPHKDKISHGHVGAVMQELGMGPKEAAMDGEEGDVEMSMTPPENVDDAHHAEGLKMAKKAYSEHLTKMGYRKYPDPTAAGTNGEDEVNKKFPPKDDDDDEEEDEVSKVNKSAIDLSAFPEKQRETLELIFKANKDLIDQNATKDKKIEELEKVVKSERDQRVSKEFQERARDFKHLGANSDELAVVMKSMSEKLTPEEYKKMESVLKAADKQIEVGSDLFAERGTRVSGTGNDSDAAIDKLVDSFVAKSDGTETREQIYDRVLQTKEGKRLAQESIRKSQQGVR